MKIDAAQAESVRVCVCVRGCVVTCKLVIDDVHISSNKHKTEKKRSCNPWQKKKKSS